ncbi:RidA family protein [Paludibaculum fermentans]|uniref:RidA family protein n=1 Tax=Paludibaculum fermentans TaxID=1473598 RepID=A0A7S7SIG2_PALFE|nr:RidA family protein [Paludibaculum fermentans]QOY84910.1 RidA family protein [Paludibaculum fermentans]
MSEQRINISSGAKWEPVVGYSRAVRIGAHVWVAGTTAVDEQSEIVGEGDAYEQAKYVFHKIGRALKQAGASLDDVVRTRMFITHLAHQDAIGRAHFEAVGHVRPAATMVQISGLVDSRLLVEIEVDAYIAGD